MSDFDIFWKLYPNKKGKFEARQWWRRHRPDKVLLRKMLAAIEAQTLERQAYESAGLWHAAWPMGSTWLRKRRWEDQIQMPAVAKPLRVPFDMVGRSCTATSNHQPCGAQATWKGYNEMGFEYFRCDEHTPKAWIR